MIRIGVLTRNPNSWCSSKIIEAIKELNLEAFSFSFSDIIAKIGFKEEVLAKGLNLCKDLDSLIVRPIGRCSLDEAIFRLDILYKLEREGLKIINPPKAIERAIDKFHTLSLLKENNIPVPKTLVTENPKLALDGFEELNSNVVIKPIFGSRGLGITRIDDKETLRRLVNSLAFMHNVLYEQEFIPHGTKDIRIFVVGGEVVASMVRLSYSWKTNISLGAKPLPFEPDKELKELALKSCEILGCKVAGVDIMSKEDEYIVNEINSQPGFRALQSVTKINIARKIVELALREAKR
ncbi:Alpha-aminoadipate--LysW ligase LysX [archaeon HR06]|nr:Alpha-aminoadipate--LysW ligase LysX [archaeon HR06]